MATTHFFGKRYKNRGFWGFWKTPLLGKKWWNYFLPVFKAPHFLGVTFFCLFFSFFFLFLLHLARGCSKKTYFYRVFAHPSKASSAIMQQQGSKAKTPKKKGCTFFFGNPFFDQFFSKALILHHPLKTVHQKISKNPYFYRLKKRWPSYWPYHGQVIDPTLAKKWPSYRPYSIYIYIYALWSYYLVQVWGFLEVIIWSKLGFLEVIIWSKFVFLAYKNSGFKRFVLHTQLSFCVFLLSPIFWQFSKNSLFQKKGATIGFFNF